MKTFLNSGPGGSTPAGQFTDLTPYYDELMQDVPYEAWVEYVRLLFDVAHISPRTILDCACGTGNVSYALADCGYDVIGIDLSPGMVAHAQSKQRRGAPYPVQFLQADLTSFKLPQIFDAATCLYDSFNYILEPAKLHAAFAQIAAHVTSGGAFVFDMNTPWAFEADLFTQQNRNPKHNLHYRWQARYNKETRICSVEMQFERKTERGELQRFAETHHERAYEMDAVLEMLARSGWHNPRVYDAYTLNAPHKKSERWFFLAERV